MGNGVSVKGSNRVFGVKMRLLEEKKEKKKKKVSIINSLFRYSSLLRCRLNNKLENLIRYRYAALQTRIAHD